MRRKKILLSRSCSRIGSLMLLKRRKRWVGKGRWKRTSMKALLAWLEELIRLALTQCCTIDEKTDINLCDSLAPVFSR